MREALGRDARADQALNPQSPRGIFDASTFEHFPVQLSRSNGVLTPQTSPVPDKPVDRV
jgi:hypothetical protein